MDWLLKLHQKGWKILTHTNTSKQTFHIMFSQANKFFRCEHLMRVTAKTNLSSRIGPQ